MKINKNRGFEIGTLIFWLALVFLVIGGLFYKQIFPKVKQASENKEVKVYNVPEI
jgi:hypothetical protein